MDELRDMGQETAQDDAQVVAQDVADGQSVVDAVAQDTQNIADGVVTRVEQLLRQQSETVAETATVSVSAEQWESLEGFLRFTTTSMMLCCFATMAVFGAVCAGYLVKGWRRG